MIPPTAADIRAMSKVDFDALGYGDDSDLQVVVDQALAYLTWVTARPFDDTMPPPLEPIALQASRMRTEQVAFQSQEDYVETGTDDVVGSFSAGRYSETRHDPLRKGESRALNSWPALNELLWLLLGTSAAYPNDAVDAQRAYWMELLTGVVAPALAITEVDWSYKLLAAGMGSTYAEVPYPWPVWSN